MLMIDTTPLARIGAFEIVEEHKLVRWTDGSSAALHFVHNAESIDGTYLALQILTPNSAWFVFPVMPICPALANGMREHHRNDWSGLIYFELRAAFENADELHRAVLDWQAREAVRQMRRGA